MQAQRWKYLLVSLGLVLALVGLVVGLPLAARAQGPAPQGATAALGTAFTYQGRLTEGNNLANGTYDFQFKLYDAGTGGSQVGSTVTKSGVSVSEGLFSVELDFGSVFDGTALWLEVAVKKPSESSYTTLGRQKLTAAPYAAYARKAPWSGLTGVPAGLDDGDNDTLAGLSCSSGQIAEWNGSQWVCGTDDTGGGGGSWSLTGNAGTTPGTNFLGTTDSQPLEVRVNNQRALRIEPGSSPNLIGGYSGNSVTAGVVGAVIGGGGASGNINRVSADYATVGGGDNNTASGINATVSGGSGNTASGNLATVGGGTDNTASDFGATIGGGLGNTAAVTGTVIGGGQGNLITGTAQYATVGGGQGNTANGAFATVGGGSWNTASVTGTVIGGGQGNLITGTAQYATVGGGAFNTVSGTHAFVGGGENNTASAEDTTVAGGVGNVASASGAFVGGGGTDGVLQGGNQAKAPASAIVGGLGNVVEQSAGTSFIGGGFSNLITATYGTIAGGYNITVTGQYATVGGGAANSASDGAATVGGGDSNTASSGWATVGGGVVNTASGLAATVPGGHSNTAAGDYSFAAGRRAKANHGGAFVWGDNTNADINSPAANTFVVRANGGIWFGRATGAITPVIGSGVFISTSTGAYLSDAGVWTDVSDRNAKENFEPIDPQAVLEKVAQLPITTWNYKAEDPSVRHLGPTAQDFYAAFGLGADDTHIASLDSSGVALAAVQGLYERNRTLEAENAELRTRVEALEQENAVQQAQIEALEARLDALEGRRSGPMGHLTPSLSAGALLLVGALAWVERRRRPSS